MRLQKVQDAATVYKHLNGILNIYKPAGVALAQVKSTILHGISSDLNGLDSDCNFAHKNCQYKALPTTQPSAVDSTQKGVELSGYVSSVLGPRYEMEDFRCRSLTSLGRHSSGVVLLGLSSGSNKMPYLSRKPMLRVYHLTGQFGTSTENHFPDSLITAKARYRHVRPNILSSMVASMQASHQRKLYEMHGVDLQSQAAYEIACRGMLPPADNTLPIIYGIKLIDFQIPTFTLEVHAMNESEMYLAALIHDIALEVRTVAHCKAIRCIRVGQYRVEDALLRHGWKLAGVIKNLRDNKTKHTKSFKCSSHKQTTASDNIQ